MKKETSIAIFMGIGFGLLVSFIIILNTQKNQSVSQKTIAPKVRPATTDQQGVTQQFTISEPNDGMLSVDPTVSVKGKTAVGSFIIIQTQIKDYSFTTKAENFEYSIPLALGENTIHINIYPKGTGGKIQEKELHVYYLTTKQ